MTETGRGGLRLLVVDDDPVQLELLSKTLGGLFHIKAHASPEEALLTLRAEAFDLLLADQKMPEMTGVEFLGKARAVRPGARRIIMSAYAEAGDLLSAIDTGDVHRFLQKPVTLDALRACTELLHRETQPEANLCVIVDAQEERGIALADSLHATGELSGIAETKLEARPLPAVAILVEPKSPHDVEEAIAILGGPDRRAAIMVALPTTDAPDAAAYLAVGADDVLWQPVRAEEVMLRYRTWRVKKSAHHEAERVRLEILAQQPLPYVVGRSEAMRRVFGWIHRVAPTDSTVLFWGETGTGKELLARAVHAISHRREKPFLPVNLSALPEPLIESELFGHEPGAFTGAQARRQGRLETVAGGTLFLDEIGDLAMSLQVKLLRVLEEKRFERLGSNKTRDADFRLVCATHRNLEEMVAQGKFREDLYYRINVVRIDLPPLRERTGDVPLLAAHFLERYRQRARLQKVTFTDEAMRTMVRHDWPGNIRELEHLIERAVAMSKDGDAIGPDLLWTRPSRKSFRSEVEGFFESGRGLKEVLRDIERAILVETLQRFDGNQGMAAAKLRIPRQTLQNRLRKLGI